MFFKRKPDPKKMDAIAEAIGGFMKMSLEAVDKSELTEADQAVADCFLFGAVDFMAQSNKIGDTQTVSKITGLVLAKYLSVDMDSAWERVLSMASMSSGEAGKAIMSQGGKAFHDFARSQNPESLLVLRELINGEYFSVTKCFSHP